MTDPASTAAGLETALTVVAALLGGLGVSAPFVVRLLGMVRRFRAAYEALRRAIEGHKIEAAQRGVLEATHVRSLTRRIAREVREAGPEIESFHAASLAAAGQNLSPILGAVLRGEAPQA